MYHIYYMVSWMLVFMQSRKNARKAISPILATVILIAITLIAAIAIAGFAFGLFGTFTSSANPEVSVVNCDSGTNLCTLSLTNTGGASASITGCSIYGTADTAAVFTADNGAATVA